MVLTNEQKAELLEMIGETIVGGKCLNPVRVISNLIEEAKNDDLSTLTSDEKEMLQKMTGMKLNELQEKADLRISMLKVLLED